MRAVKPAPVYEKLNTYNFFMSNAKKNLLGYEKLTLFYRSADPFSNWYRSPFKFLGTEFATSEQFMMFGKAQLFDDLDAAKKIMESTDPRDNKEAGRVVRGFRPNEWERSSRPIVYAGCWAKFTSTTSMLEYLLATKGTLLVEASPTDRIWGIGLAIDDPKALNPEKWRGTNWLGEVLTQLRDDLITGTPMATPEFINAWFKEESSHEAS